MKATDIQKLLAALDTHGTVGGGWVRGPCPLAPWKHQGGVDNHPSFGVQIDEHGMSKARCFTCGVRGDLEDLCIAVQIESMQVPRQGIQLKVAREIAEQDGQDLVFSVIDYDAKIQAVKSAKNKLPIPADWITSFAPAWGSPVAQAYLKTRNVTESSALKFNVRWDSVKERVCFPVTNQGGSVKALQGRTIHADVEPRYYMYPHANRDTDVWLGEDRCNLTVPLVVTEGAFDLVNIDRVYPNVVAGLMASVSYTKMKFLRDALHIVTMYDVGKGGSIAREKMSKFGTQHHITVTHLIPQDDAGGATESELAELLSAFGA